MDGPVLEVVAAERTVVAASATAAALGRILLAPAYQRGRCWRKAVHSSAFIFALVWFEEM